MNEAVAPTHAIVELGLDQEHLRFALLSSPAPAPPVTCPVDRLRRLFAGEGRLDAARVENAIAQVEDLIMPVLRGLAHGPHLHVIGPELSRVLGLAAQGAEAPVAIALIENLFNQLADHVSGSPYAWRHDAPPETIAPALVVLREVMHHGGFADALAPRSAASGDGAG